MKKKTENETATFLISEKLSASYKYGFLLTNPNQVISLIIINSLFLKKKKIIIIVIKTTPHKYTYHHEQSPSNFDSHNNLDFSVLHKQKQTNIGLII